MKRMLVNLQESDECRIAVMDNGRLEEVYVERAGRPTLGGNIYKGRVVNIEPSIQAAFVDIGHQLKGFLHVSDVVEGALRRFGKKPPKSGNRRAIQSVLRRGMEIPVQVSKDGIGKKGPALTTQISLPGRHLVLMPFLPKHGVSRKIVDDKERKRLKEILLSLDPPKDIGFIVRTAGKGRRKTDLQRDMKYVQRIWNDVEKRAKAEQAPALLYQETSLVVRTIRDIFTPDIARILVDTQEGYREAREFVRVAMPRHVHRVQQYDGEEPLFQRFRAESEMAKIFDRRVPLPSGGSIVIDTTEAMVTIDVNSGRFTKADDTEEMALKINLEAAEQIARQLVLRDLGGLIVVDFIDMRLDKNRRQVEKIFRQALKTDRARLRMLRMSAFCLVEMTRQRLRPSLSLTHYDRCPVCQGTGMRLNPESLGARILRQVRSAARRESVHKVEVRAHRDIALFLLNDKRDILADMEDQLGKSVEVYPVDGPPESFEIQARRENGNLVKG